MTDIVSGVSFLKADGDATLHSNYSGTRVNKDGLDHEVITETGITVVANSKEDVVNEEESQYNQGDVLDNGDEGDSDSSLKKEDGMIADQTQEDEDKEEEAATGLLKYRAWLFKALQLAFAVLVVVYLLAALIIDFHRAIALFVLTVLVTIWNVWAYWAKHNANTVAGWEEAALQFFSRCETDPKFGGSVTSLLLAIMIVIMAVSVKDARNMVSLFGLVVFIALTWAFLWKPGHVKWRPVIGGFWGLAAIQFLSNVFVTLLNYNLAGSSFVFLWLTNGALYGEDFQLVNGGAYNLGPPFFFSVLPTVIFFSALMSMGYYLWVLPWLVRRLGYFLAIVLGTSASESLSAAGNVFVGQTEAPLLVRPFMKNMTKSELHAIMTGGFATIAGSVFGVYVSFGVDPVSILAASVMSAPAALAISKIAFPETEESPTATGKKGAYDIPKSGDVNVVHAASNGAVIGTKLMLNIAGNLITFLDIIEMLDQLLMYLGDQADIDLSFNKLCEIFFFPFAWLMGVDPEDCDEVAVLIGLKIFANGFVAYEKLTTQYKGQISDRSFLIASHALCGFSNMGSIGIQLGGLTPLTLNQGKNLAKLVVSAMIAGNTACFITECIAGIFYEAG